MSISVFILGESGTGKSASMRHLFPTDVCLIQAVGKPLPFQPKGWATAARKSEEGKLVKTGEGGNIFITDEAEHICTILERTTKDIIIIDDFQYVMANEFMRGVTVEAKGNEQFMKFNRIAHNAWRIINTANSLPEHKRVYILSHTQTDDYGKTKAKTIGKLLDEKITLEGLFTIVLRTQAANGHYTFQTQNNGSDTVKSPMELFESVQIPNDLAQIDVQICNYYNIPLKGNQDVQTQ